MIDHPSRYAMKSSNLTPRKREKGQILVIMALVFIGMIAIVGLAIDTGYMYVSYSRLRRAVDAAALSATSQYKRNVSTATLEAAARQFLILNGAPAGSVTATVETCTTTIADTTRFPSGNGDPTLCFTPRRKLVRIIANQDVPLFFLSVVGLRSVPISVTSVSEAAALEVVLIIDRSESMGTVKPDGTDYPVPAEGMDPVACNSDHPSSAPDGTPSLWTGDCHPFQEVKSAAYNFVTTFMDAPYDRVAIVVFDNVAEPVDFRDIDPAYSGAPGPVYLDGDLAQVQKAIRGLWIYDGFVDTGFGQDHRARSMDPATYAASNKAPVCDFDGQVVLASHEFTPCRLHAYNSAQFFRIDYQGFNLGDIYPATYGGGYVDATGTGSTNIGMGLNWGAKILKDFGARQEALWVSILLTDGVPNAGYDVHGAPICPFDSADPGNAVTDTRKRKNYCNDNVATQRHNIIVDNSTTPVSYTYPAAYDADDYSRDMADVLSASSLIFSIGLGDSVTSTAFSNPPVGASLLNYIALQGGTQSYYQADANELQKIFLAIAGKIATRLTR